MTRTSALFIDFDNFFSGLLAADPAAALDVVTRPSVWLNRLRYDECETVVRRWLVLRCYLNPSGSVVNPTNNNERLYFSNFRPYFTQAGIEVVDCPPLTKRAKNGADIRIAVDVMTLLRAETRYDEIVLASSDADFTPLLQVTRAHDRRVTIVSTGSSSAAYEALADELLDEQDVIELTQHRAPDEGPPSVNSSLDHVVPDGPAQEWSQSEQEKFASIVRAEYVESAEPINLARLASRLRIELGEVTTRTKWFGAGGFIKAIKALDLPNAEYSQTVVADTTRHVLRVTSPPAGAAHASPTEASVVLPPVIAKFRQVTRLPAISTSDWRQVYQSLATYAQLHEFNFTESTRWSRDHAAETGHDIGRQAFTYVVRACHVVGVPLYGDPPPSEEQISRALVANVVNLAQESGVDVTDADVHALGTWVGVVDPG